MPKKFKILLATLVSLVALVVIALVGISVYISNNADEYKHYLTDAIEQKAGMKVGLDGPFSVSVFPWIGVEAEDVNIENPDSFKTFGENLLAADKIGVELKLIPLLSGDIEVGDVHVSGLKLGLVVNSAGVGNWIFGSADDKMPKTESSPANVESSSDSSRVIVEDYEEESAKWSIGSVLIDNSNISYLDAREKTEYRLENINLETGNLGVGKDISIDFTSNIFASSPELEGNLTLDAEFNFEDAKNIEISTLKGTFSSNKGLLNKDVVNIDLSSTLAGSNVDVWQFMVELAGTKVVLSGKGNIENLTFTGPLNIQSKPKQLLTLIGMTQSLSSSSALEDFSLNAQFSSDKADETRISNITAKLDSTTITGDLLVKMGDAPRVSGEIAVGDFALDGYLPKPASSGGGSSKDKTGGKSTGASASSENKKYNPPKLGLDVDLSIASLKAMGMEIKNLKSKLNGKDSIYSLDPLSFDFADSKWAVKLSANLKQETPFYRTSFGANGINLGEVLKEKTQISGSANLSTNITASGSDADAIMKSLGGTGKVSAKGQLNSLKLPEVNLEAAPGVKSMDRVSAKLNDFSASFTGKNGIFSNKDMLFDTSVGGGSGAGTVNIGTSSVDYLVTLETSVLDLPIRISGPFSNLKYSLDAKAMLLDSDNLSRGAKKLIDKHGKDIEDKLGKGIQDGLGKLFGK